MFKNKKIKILKTLDKTLKRAPNRSIPEDGWVNFMRKVLNMSMAQLGKRIGVSAQGIYALEQREKGGEITLKKMHELAHAMGLQFEYKFVPHTSLESMVTQQASTKARQIVTQSHHNMKLEAQEVPPRELESQIKELASDLKKDVNSVLWD